jgi:transcriptional regulator with XRE-family HTH domain
VSSASPFPTSLGEIIRKQREIAELPLRQLASMAKISNPYLSQIEHGLREPSEQVLEAIARSLQVSADDLLDSVRAASADNDESGLNSVAAAIRDDPNLTAKQKQALLETYTAMIGATAYRRGRRRDAAEPPADD